MVATSIEQDFHAWPSCGLGPSLNALEYNNASQAENLVLMHLPLVRKIASRMRLGLPPHIELDELVSAGVVGLVDAASRFDPAKDIRFGSYAQFRIRGAILDFLRSLDWCPREVRKKKRSIDSTVPALTATLGRSPSVDEIAKANELTVAEYHDILTDVKQATLISIDTPGDSETADAGELPIPGPVEYDPLYQCFQNESRDRIAAALDKLPERQRLVLTLYYYEELTMKEIGEILGLAQSRISQIHSATLRSLRRILSTL